MGFQVGKMNKKSLFKFQKNTSFLKKLKILLLLASCTCYSAAQNLYTCQDSICHFQIVTDSLFNSPQRINLLLINKKSLPDYKLEFAYQTSELLSTSQMAKDHGAIAGINGSFFDMDKGGSVSYFEKDDSVINRTRPPGLKWAVSDSLINAAVVLRKDHSLVLEHASPEQFYEKSDKEAFGMVTGPLLIKDSIPQRLPDKSFTHKRHPRTCVGITRESIIFICIDGRSDQAAGMSLIEVQDFLLDLGCSDAINLDGGGSTSMWIMEKGILNVTSEYTGEWPVSYALFLLNK